MLTLATYWHTSMADRYDINDISQRLFVSILLRTCHCVNSHLGQFRGLNFYLSHESSSWEFAIIDWVLSLVTLEPQFLMILNPWQADPILFLNYIGPSIDLKLIHSSAFVREVLSRGISCWLLLNANCMALRSWVPVWLIWIILLSSVTV